MNNNTIPENPPAETELQSAFSEFRATWPDLKTLPARIKSLEDQSTQQKDHLASVRRIVASRSGHVPRFTPPGTVSDECARHFAATFIAHCEKSGKLEAFCSVPSQRDALKEFARDTLDL